MSQQDILKLSSDEVGDFAKKASSHEIETSVSEMNLEQIATLFAALSDSTDVKWKEKTRAAILGLNQRPQLEAAGRVLTIEQIMELVESTLQIEDKHHWKLSPILVGMPHAMFNKFLERSAENELHILQHEGISEPVQHHLTTLSHEMENRIKTMEAEIDLFDQQLESLEVDRLSRADIQSLISQIDQYADTFRTLFAQANKALAIAWNTNRTDLIESFSKVKDSCQKYAVYGIGEPKTPRTAPTGLYAKLDGILFSVFGDPSNASDLEALKDTEPAMEALVKFSVWYLRDYWEMGLLPTVNDAAELDLDMQKHTEIERAAHREKLFTEVKANLQKIGLGTVRDLKNMFIFSRKTLQEYIGECLQKQNSHSKK